MPLGRRRPIARAAVIGTVAYQGSKRGAEAGASQAEADASQAEAAGAPPAVNAPPPAAAPEDPTIEKINQLAQLHDSGVLTDEEFAAAKAKALGID
jgi:hypothetical protein